MKKEYLWKTIAFLALTFGIVSLTIHSPASAGSSGTQICVNKKSGSLRIAKPKCNSSEGIIYLGAVGPQGPKGERGPQGPSGPIGGEISAGEVHLIDLRGRDLGVFIPGDYWGPEWYQESIDFNSCTSDNIKTHGDFMLKTCYYLNGTILAENRSGSESGDSEPGFATLNCSGSYYDKVWPDSGYYNRFSWLNHPSALYGRTYRTSETFPSNTVTINSFLSNGKCVARKGKEVLDPKKDFIVANVPTNLGDYSATWPLHLGVLSTQ